MPPSLPSVCKPPGRPLPHGAQSPSQISGWEGMKRTQVCVYPCEAEAGLPVHGPALYRTFAVWASQPGRSRTVGPLTCPSLDLLGLSFILCGDRHLHLNVLGGPVAGGHGLGAHGFTSPSLLRRVPEHRCPQLVPTFLNCLCWVLAKGAPHSHVCMAERQQGAQGACVHGPGDRDSAG